MLEGWFLDLFPQKTCSTHSLPLLSWIDFRSFNYLIQKPWRNPLLLSFLTVYVLPIKKSYCVYLLKVSRIKPLLTSSSAPSHLWTVCSWSGLLQYPTTRCVPPPKEPPCLLSRPLCSLLGIQYPGWTFKTWILSVVCSDSDGGSVDYWADAKVLAGPRGSAACGLPAPTSGIFLTHLPTLYLCLLHFSPPGCLAVPQGLDPGYLQPPPLHRMGTLPPRCWLHASPASCF